MSAGYRAICRLGVLLGGAEGVLTGALHGGTWGAAFGLILGGFYGRLIATYSWRLRRQTRVFAVALVAGALVEALGAVAVAAVVRELAQVRPIAMVVTGVGVFSGSVGLYALLILRRLTQSLHLTELEEGTMFHRLCPVLGLFVRLQRWNTKPAGAGSKHCWFHSLPKKLAVLSPSRHRLAYIRKVLARLG